MSADVPADADPKAIKEPDGRVPRKHGARSAKDIKLVGAVASATKVLRHLSTAPSPVGVTQLARELHLNPSTCFNILKTLVHDDLVRFDPRSKTYAISLGVIELAKGALTQSAELRVIQPMMTTLAKTHDVTVTLWRRVSDDRMMLVAGAESDAAIRIHMTIGTRAPLLLGAMGRVMAASLNIPKDELKQRFDKLRWNRPIDFDLFLDQVEETKRNGWAIDDGYYHRGTMTVCAPVITGNGEVTMCCNATMFVGQHDPRRITQIADEVCAIGNSVA